MPQSIYYFKKAVQQTTESGGKMYNVKVVSGGRQGKRSSEWDPFVWESGAGVYDTGVLTFHQSACFSMEIEYGNLPNPGGAKPVNAEDKDLKDTMGWRLILSLRPAHLTRPSPLFRLVYYQIGGTSWKTNVQVSQCHLQAQKAVLSSVCCLESWAACWVKKQLWLTLLTRNWNTKLLFWYIAWHSAMSGVFMQYSTVCDLLYKLLGTQSTQSRIGRIVFPSLSACPTNVCLCFANISTHISSLSGTSICFYNVLALYQRDALCGILYASLGCMEWFSLNWTLI